jgi:hypothetical protein
MKIWSHGLIFRRGDTPGFALPLFFSCFFFKINFDEICSYDLISYFSLNKLMPGYIEFKHDLFRRTKFSSANEHSHSYTFAIINHDNFVFKSKGIFF